ncbi:MAG TPA: hypothetical protein VJA26_09105 [Gammaproteobacteria bacterium]|nr:hypothetical protein [Gammaproteobacteria bacterium]
MQTSSVESRPDAGDWSAPAPQRDLDVGTRPQADTEGVRSSPADGDVAVSPSPVDRQPD